MSKNLYWCSWVQPTDDHRPIDFPPNESILGWWCSGYSQDGANLCAWVVAEDEVDVRKQINKSWPEITITSELRFCDKKDHYIPCDRFQPNEWMEPRLEKYKEQLCEE